MFWDQSARKTQYLIGKSAQPVTRMAEVRDSTQAVTVYKDPEQVLDAQLVSAIDVLLDGHVCTSEL